MDNQNLTEKQSTDESRRRGVVKTLVDLLFVIFCGGLPSFYLFIGNLTELRFREIIVPLLVSTGIGWILYVILRLTLKKSSMKAAMITGIIMVVVSNAGLLTLPLGYAAALAISAVIITGLILVVTKLAGVSVTEKIEFILTGVIAALILFNAVMSIPQLDKNELLSEQAAAKAASLEKIEVPAKYAGKNVPLPNMYVFIFDELAGTQCMKEVFNYDNTGFYNDMRKLGFNVSDKSTNYKHFTYECLSGVFNFDYAFSYDVDGTFACQERFWKARFFTLMQEMGYSLHERKMGAYNDYVPHFKYDMSNQYSETEDGISTPGVILDRSLLAPIVDALAIFPKEYDLNNQVLNYFADPANYKFKGALRYTYLCCPHAPFIYDINGGPVDPANRINWSDPKYFLEQYEYMCGRIEDTMKNIIKNDPDSIIFVISDHGVKQNKYLWNGPSTTAEQATDTFAAVYTGGRDDLGNINGLSGADVLRTIFNKEYGFNIEMVGPPEN